MVVEGGYGGDVVVMEVVGAFWLWWKVVVDEDLWWLKVEGVCYGGGCGGGKLVRVKEVEKVG